MNRCYNDQCPSRARGLKVCKNPFHSWWYTAAAKLQPLYRVFGFTLCLQRSRWTKCHARLTLAWIGWGESDELHDRRTH